MGTNDDQRIANGALELFDGIEALFDAETGKCSDRLMAMGCLVELRTFLQVNSVRSFQLSRSFDDCLVRLPKTRSRVDDRWRSRLYSARISIDHDYGCGS